MDASNLGELFGTIMAGPGEIHRGLAFQSTSVTVISQVRYWVKMRVPSNQCFIYLIFRTVESDRKRSVVQMEITQGNPSLQRSVLNKARIFE